MVTVDFDDGFNTKVCSVDNIIIAVYINGVGHWAIEFAEGGLQECPKFGCRGHTFRRWMVTVDFEDVSIEKYG